MEKVFLDKNVTSKSECKFLAANAQWCLSYSLVNVKNICNQWKDDLENLNVLEYVNASALNEDEAFSIDHDRVRVFTHQGICYSDNIQDFDVIFDKNEIHEDFLAFKNVRHPGVEWSVERGYFDGNSSYPERFYPHQSHDFYIELSKMHEKNACTSKSMFAYIHLPNEMPTEYHKFIPIAYGSKTSIVLTGKSYRTDENLRSYPPKVRNCYFDGERKLQFFKSYSKAQCQFECVANSTLKYCNCVPFWYPRNKTTRPCRLSQMECVDGMNIHYHTIEQPSCDCYPPCNDIKYEANTSPTLYYNFYLAK